MKNPISIEHDYLAFLETSVPPLWQTKTALARLKTIKGLADFYALIFAEGGTSESQLFQDLFVSYIFAEQDTVGKRFLEFGATDGYHLSNSFMLETKKGWQGVLAEPDPQWHQALKKNRPNTRIITDCIYTDTGKKMPFVSSEIGELSGLKNHSHEDAEGPLQGNTEVRFKKYKEIEVTTISLNDVFENHFEGTPIDYMSVDTEGSEFEILSSFNFERYHPSVVTVEHNYTASQAKLDRLFSASDYVRIFPEFTNFDAWYVRKNIARDRQLIR